MIMYEINYMYLLYLRKKIYIELRQCFEGSYLIIMNVI